MGFPLKSWSDIISNKKELNERNLNSDFFCFILYKAEHIEFRDYILRNFNKLHDDSGNIMFFILDKPEKWLKRIDIDYYRKIYGNQYRPELNDKEVDLVCDYFSIHPNKLPAVIAFPNLHSKSCNMFSLKDIVDENKLTLFFKELFNREPIINTRASKLSNTSESIRRSFSNISIQISLFEDNKNISDQFDKLNEAISQMRQEMRDGFNTIIVKLESIKEQMMPFKMNLAKRLNELNQSAQSNMKDSEIDKLHNKVDEDLIKYTNEIIKDVGTDIYCSLAKYDYLECFELDSINMIRSCFITENLVMKESIEEFDYSLCSVGFWKAMEIELNIILIDTIRFLNKLIVSIPSEGISLRSGKQEVFAGYKIINSIRKEYKVNVNNKYSNKLSSIMFGDLIKVSENYKENELIKVLEIIYKDANNIIDMNIFMNSFIEQLSEVVYEFRNKCSHTGIMEKGEYIKLKTIIFSENGLYRKIALLKNNINTDMLIL